MPCCCIQRLYDYFWDFFFILLKKGVKKKAQPPLFFICVFGKFFPATVFQLVFSVNLASEIFLFSLSVQGY